MAALILPGFFNAALFTIVKTQKQTKDGWKKMHIYGAYISHTHPYVGTFPVAQQ